jgi:hypothetical protein
MSSISGINSSLINNILSALTGSNSVEASTDSQPANTDDTSSAKDQTNSLNLVLAEDQFSLNQSILNATIDSSSNFENLAMSAENLTAINKSNLINTNPNLVASLLSGSFSQTSEPPSLGNELLNTLEEANTSPADTDQLEPLLQLMQLENQDDGAAGSILDTLA